ncbi:MAG: hypothetical protein WBA22_00810 [Candidatus Methanofastidiosia archaeon]
MQDIVHPSASREVISYLRQRGWHKKPAKSSGISLLHHTMVELDVLSSMLPLLEDSLGITKRDVPILQLAIIAHDSGKEKDEWQDYLSRSDSYRTRIASERPEYVSHIDLSLAREIISDIKEVLEPETNLEKDVLTILRIIDSHMKKDRMDPGRAFQKIVEQREGKLPEKWLDLALIVSFIDDLCSCERVEDVVLVLRRPRSGEYEKFRQTLDVAFHRVSRIRGISTSLIHKAAQKAHARKGWIPILHFPDGTAYVGSIGAEILSKDSILEELNITVREFVDQFPDANAYVVVGKPTASSISTEVIFQPEELDQYLREVIRKNRSRKPENIDKVIEYLLNKSLAEYFLSQSSADLSLFKPFNQRKKKRMKFINDPNCNFKDSVLPTLAIPSSLDSDETFSALAKSRKGREKFYVQHQLDGEKVENRLEELRIMLSESKPYCALVEFMCDLVGRRSLVNDNAQKFLIDNIANKFGKDERSVKKYKEILPLTGSYNPLPFQILFVDYLPEIFGQEFEEEFISWIKTIFATAWDNYGFEFQSLDEKCGALLRSDLISPVAPDYAEDASKSKKFYRSSKEEAFSKKPEAQKMCPICNTYFEGENKSIADIVGFSKKFSNRLVGSRSLSNFNICQACELEYLLRSLVLTERPSELAIVYPQMNITFELGEALKKKFRELNAAVERTCGSKTTDLSKFLLIRNLDQIAETISQEGADFLQDISAADFVQYFIFSRDPEKPTMQNAKEIILQALETSYPWDSVQEFNEDKGTSYDSFEELVDDILNGRNLNREFILEVQEEVRKKKTRKKEIAPVYVTPNFAVLFLSDFQSLKAEDTSDTDAGFKKIFLSSILSILFDSSVALLEANEEIPNIPEGLVFTPSVGNVVKIVSNVRKGRTVPGRERWLSRTERDLWTNLLAAAILIKSKAKMSERTGIFEVLSSPTVGHLMRRMELKKKSINFEDMRILNKLESMEVLG